MDFREPHHLPREGRDPADPAGLPRQRRGVTPQMHGRYPDYDVLEQAGHWDEATRRVVLDRVENVPPIRFFEPHEARTLEVFCDVVMHQDAEPKIAVLNYVDERLHEGRLDGYQYEGLPDDGETWRIVARELDEEARRLGLERFRDGDWEQCKEIVRRFAHGNLELGIDCKHAWAVVTRMILSAFYAHPWSWNEIGFGGPAYPRGYARFGSPHLGVEAETEEWEGHEAFAVDPVTDVRERGLE
jgi:Gluconate 2-dehydrogenase subunit 3